MATTSGSDRWPRAPLFLAAAAILLPPLGLLALWFRRRTALRWKILGTIPIAALAAAYLHFFFGLQIEFYGGLRPYLTFHRPRARLAELERRRAATAAGAAGVVKTPAGLDEAPWPEFRGPRRDGRYDQGPVLAEWPPKGLRLLWRQPIGGGYASFSIARGRAFTIEQRLDREVVTAYEVATGRELWAQGWEAHFEEFLGGDGPRATPTWDDGRVYALGAAGDLYCLDESNGAARWGRNILADSGAKNVEWGMAASPLVAGKLVVALPGGRDGKSIIAYDKLSGEIAWSALDDREEYVSPMRVALAGREQILAVTAGRAVGLAPADGALLWEFPWKTPGAINIAQPVLLGGDRIFLSAGYGHGCAVLELAAAGEAEPGKAISARAVWESRSLKNKFASSVLYQGHIYGLDDTILACIDASTGERRWKGGRYGYGQLLLAGDRLIVLSEQGELALVRAEPGKHEELARFQALEGKCWNVPAIAGGYLLLRNAAEMACYRIAP